MIRRTHHALKRKWGGQLEVVVDLIKALDALAVAFEMMTAALDEASAVAIQPLQLGLNECKADGALAATAPHLTGAGERAL